jgi:integrase
VSYKRIPKHSHEGTDKAPLLGRPRYKRRYKGVLKTVALTRNKSGEYIARKGIPKDVRQPYAKLFGLGWEVRLTLPAHLTESAAKAKHGEWLAEIETRIETLRATANGKGQPLTQKQAHALAGRWYRWFTRQYEANPGDPKHWRELLDILVWDVIRPHAPHEHEEHPAEADPSWGWAKAPEVREAVRPFIVQEARVASFLLTEGITLNADAYALFVDAVADNFQHALMLVERWATGNYEADETPQSFPEFIPTNARAADNGTPQLDPWQLWEAFVMATSLAVNTVDRWQGVFRKLKADFPGRGAGTITSDEAQAWITGLVGEERTADTVRAVWVSACRRVFSWAVKNKHIAANPFASVALEKPKRNTTRPKWFTQAEMALILEASLGYTNPQTATERARRWVPWLLAYSGARAGEITQLRGSDVGEHEGVMALRLTPEAGTIKTREARWVPVHEHLVEQGFLKFVAAQGAGPLFYRDPPKKMRVQQQQQPDKLKPRQTPPQTARVRLARWTRGLGVTDKGLSPTHAWRHTFQRYADRAGIPEKISDAIVGHKPANVARTYAVPTVVEMADALKMFPRYVLDLHAAQKQPRLTGLHRLEYENTEEVE